MTTKLGYGPAPAYATYQEESALPPGAAAAIGGTAANAAGLKYLNMTVDTKRDKDSSRAIRKMVDEGIPMEDAGHKAIANRKMTMKGRRLAGAGILGGIGATVYGVNKLHDHFSKESSYSDGYNTIMKVARLPAKSVGAKGSKMLRDLKDTARKGVSVSDAALYVGAPGAAATYLYSRTK
jgi:hypothetical protein